MIEAVFETWVAPELEVVDEVVVDDVVVEVLVSAVVVVVSVVVVVVLALSSTTPDEDLLAVQSKGQHQPSEQPLSGSAIAISIPTRIGIFFIIFCIHKPIFVFNFLIITWRCKTLLRDFLINLTVITPKAKNTLSSS
jgi:hypothetical protein